jgi:hypothetical protein
MVCAMESGASPKATERQKELLKYMLTFQREHGYPPTLREIGAKFGIKSTNAVSCHIAALVRRGFLTRVSMRSRGIQILPSAHVAVVGDAVTDLHHGAMAHADAADGARRRGEHDEALKLFRQALRLEQEAIATLAIPIEPTWSVLHRSAASLALDCDERRLAEKLCCTALAADPPAEIARELRALIGMRGAA